MKRVVRPSIDPEVLKFDIDIMFQLDLDDVAATTIRPILDPLGSLNDQALADYQAFVETAMGIIDYYGFQILSIKDSGTFPHTSKYVWLAHASEVESEDIPLMIKLRISDHVQQFSSDSRKRIAKQTREEAQALKKPESKKRQRYKVVEITTDNEKFTSYEEVLNYLDNKVYSWLERLDIDMSEYDKPLGNWQ